MGPVTLEEIERRADCLGEQVKEAVQKELLDLAGTGYVGSSVLCSPKERPVCGSLQEADGNFVWDSHRPACLLLLLNLPQRLLPA